MSNLLVVEDNLTLLEGISKILKRMGHRVFKAKNGIEGFQSFKKHEIDFTITDLKMDGLDGLELLKAIKKIQPNALVMIITAHGNVEIAVQAMQRGAFDFITKPFPPDVLRLKVQKALNIQKDRQRLVEENAYLRSEVQAFQPKEIIGKSKAMQKVFALVQKVARTDSTAYIYGESGTGKELIARALHEASPRKDKSFIKVNCSALAEGVLESELFGHEKGAFTGAVRKRLGRFELADGGSLFLDEISEISPTLQLKLLRVLQEKAFERVGGTETIHVNVRIISASNRRLWDEVQAGRFREDLFYRLHIIPIELPPLRERKEDIPILVEHFIQKLAQRTRTKAKGISSEALEFLKHYDWPGNVRELENVIEQALVFAEDTLIRPVDLPPHLTGIKGHRILALPEEDRPLPELLEDLERQLILRAFRKARGVKAETARILGIKSSALYYKLDKYGIDQTLLDAKGKAQ